MASDGPSAAWHPALMPNSAADIAPNVDPVHTQQPSQQPPELPEPTQTEPASPPRPAGVSEDTNSGVDGWFPDYEAGSPWQPDAETRLLSQPQHDPAPAVQDRSFDDPLSQPAAEPVPESEPVADLEPPVFEQSSEMEPEAQPEEPAVQHSESLDTAFTTTNDVPFDLGTPHSVEQVNSLPQEPAPASYTSKHVSSDSFARTIPQQPNWMDDDEPSWSPPPTNSDPFRFMPPNERSNSFPVVPPMPDPVEQNPEPLPANQAEDLMNQIDHHSGPFDDDETGLPQQSNALQHDNLWGDDGGEADFDAQVGGDIQGPEGDASDARFAEGVPLISHEEEDDTAEQGQQTPRDPFASDNVADGDDFFAQIEDKTDTANQQDPAPGQLERKSTMQIMNGLGADPSFKTGGMLDDTVEEEDEFWSEQPQEQQSEAVATETETTTPAPAEADIPANEPTENKGEDLAAKWSEAFAGNDDDEFLLDDDPLLDDEPAAEKEQGKSFDPSAFFGDDDEGFLDDVEEPAQPSQTPAAPQRPVMSQPTGSSNKYLPAQLMQSTPNQPSNPYFPSASPIIPQAQTPLSVVPPVAPNPYAAQTQSPSVSSPYGAPAPRPPANKAQSFADKSKGGYSSPYDLPMEVVKPRKRQTQPQQQLNRAATTVPPPPPAAAVSGPPAPSRSLSAYSPNPSAVPGLPAQPPAQQFPNQVQHPGSSVSPPVSNHSGQSHSLSKPPQPLQSKASFFEDLPMSHKARPASRTSNKSQISPFQGAFNAPPQSTQPPPPSMPTPPQDQAGPGTSSDLHKLVPPAPVNPYASLPASTNAAPNLVPPIASRYSPATTQGTTLNGAVPPPSRYSPAPPAQRAHSGPSATPPAVLPHLPRTSSPLAHFEARPAGTHGEAALQTSRSSSSLYEPRLNRMSSLPPTREVDEEETPGQGAPGPISPSSSQPPPPRARSEQMSPLDSHSAGTMSPPKRKISYGPVSAITDIVPPPRSQTGSPGAMYGLRSPIKASEIAPRPLSAHGAPLPLVANTVPPTSAAPVTATRPRGMSQKLNLIPPTDGRELDPLQRWKGAPLINWGVGGTLITSFPVDVPRYGMNQVAPMIVRSPGEVKVKAIKEVQPLEERLAKFPGPLRGKSKKKEATSWLSSGIEELEKGLPNLAFQSNLSHEDKRSVERVLLWKILRVMVEHDGALEGNPTVEKAVRDILSLRPAGQEGLTSPIYASGNAIGGFTGESTATQMRADAVDSGTVQHLKSSLLAGDREKAVWDAADKRLWGHALLIANTVSPELYHKVSQEFIKKEVNFPGHNNESLAALYAVLSGNHEESVDELVPMHARAGLQMVATSTGPVNSGGLEGLEQWRETLTLVLSNRSSGDVQALNSLGNLLSGYGRAEAAHICFIFARSAAVFGGLDDPSAQFVLVGADHKTQSQQFFKETEALLLSEVYEYGLSLSGIPSLANGVPHLAVYKLQHAMTLAEHGYRDKALQYCDHLLKDMSSQTRRSPYYHPVLESAIEDLRQRIIQAPNKEASGSWISKPNMNKVSDTVWNRFNKFVAGDDTDAAGPGSPKFGEESGPFAKYSGGTPTISRPASASGFTGMEMFGTPNGYGAGPPSLAPNTVSPVAMATRASSRYAPVAAQSTAAASPYEPNSTYSPMGRSSMERTSGEYSRPYEPRRPSDVLSSSSGGYMPSNVGQGYSDPALGIMSQPAPPAPRPTVTTAQSTPDANLAGPRTPGFQTQMPSFSQQSSPYAPVNNASPYAPATATTDVKPAVGEGQDLSGSGYQPPSYGYEPHTMAAPQKQPAQITESETTNSGYGGYEPPSYGYEPPSYQPDLGTTDDAADDDKPKPRKKSFMDDDDDDFPGMSSSPASQEKSKAEKDRENDELFRKAAEEDGKSIAMFVIHIYALTIVQPNEQNKRKQPRPKRAGASAPGLAGPRKSLSTALHPTSLCAPNWAKSPVLCTILIKSAGSTKPQAQRTRRPEQPHLHRPAAHHGPHPAPRRLQALRPLRRRHVQA